MKKVVFVLLMVALIVIPLVSAQSPQEAPATGLLSPELLADPSLLTEPMTVPLGNGRFAVYIPVAEPNATQDFTASGDTFAQGVSPTSTHGGDPNLELAIYKGHPSRLYVAFNTGTVPAAATVTFARFSLFLVEWNVRSGSVATEMRRVTSYWSSSTVTWNFKPNSNSYSTRSITPATGWVDYTCTSLVETYWKGSNYGTGQNLGLEVRGPESANDYGLWFNSKEASDHRPWLYVEYTLPGATPTVTATPRPSPTPTDVPGIGVGIIKEMVSPAENPIFLGDIAEFRITVRNTGDTTLTSIALVDDYVEQCLEFVDATPVGFTVDPVFGTVTWANLCATEGPLAPGGEIVVTVRFRAIHVCPGLFYNCARVITAVDDHRNQADTLWACAPFWVVPLPPDVAVVKEFLDPVICEGDEAYAGIIYANTGGVPIHKLDFVDIYDTTFLESLLSPVVMGPDDGHLELSTMIPGPGVPPGMTALFGIIPFRGKLQTPSTINEARMVVNDYAPSEDSDTAALTILPAAGPCEGNLVLNPGFESGLSDWPHASGLPRASTVDRHSGARSLLLGILPGEPDALRVDGLVQVFTLPADAHSAVLSFWYKVSNRNDPDPVHNRFTAFLVDVATSAVEPLNPPMAFSGGWQKGTVDLTPFVGRTLAIAFGTTNDGDGTGPLWAFVDDVEICTSRCGPPVDIPRPGDGLCWKASYPDYAPNGMPDFDLKQFESPDQVHDRYMDGPAAVADCLWWFDSKFEPGSTPPPAISDGYPLVQAYNQSWDDHDERNLPPLAEDLATRLRTDGGAVPWSYAGTRPGDMAAGIRQYIASKNLTDHYAVTVVKAPSFDRVQDHVVRSNDVIMLLGFWEPQPDGWRRLGGHWVTAAGVNCSVGDKIAISDPYIDSAEQGYPGVYMPVGGHPSDHAAELHNDAAYVSHDIYQVFRKQALDGSAAFGLANYVRYDDVNDEAYPDWLPFIGANLPADLASWATTDYQNGVVETRVEYAVIVTPLDETVRLAFQPGAASGVVGEVLSVDLVVDSRTQTFETVSAYLGFDPALLQCVDAAGSPITQVPAQDLTQVMANSVDNTAGRIDLSMRVPLGNPAVKGHVVVARLYFKTLAATPAGGAHVVYSYSEPRRTDVLSGAISVLGAIQDLVVTAATPATLNVEVGLEGRNAAPSARWVGPVELSLLDPTDSSTIVTYSANTDQYGRFTIASVPVGTYAIRVKGIHTLASRRLGASVLPGANVVNMGVLAEGDVDNDNDVDASDASLLNLAFGSSPGGALWDARADLNEDDAITAVDMALLAAHYGQVGDIAVGSSPAAAKASVGPSLSFGTEVGPTAGSVVITTSPATGQVALGAVLSLDLTVQAGTQLVDTVDAWLTYDPDYLQVVNASGVPATTVQAGTALANVLVNTVNAGQGLIHFAASSSGTGLTGNIKVATLRFRAVLPTTQTRLRFSLLEPQLTTVLYHGEPVLGSWPATTIAITGGRGFSLPFIAKP